MRLVFKILALPFVLVTGILYLVCKFLVVLSGAVLGILSGIVFLAALALFHFFKNLDLGSNRFINGLAGTTPGVYILHQVPVLRDFLWNGIFHAQAHHGSAAYTLLVIVLTFAGCAAIDTLRTRFIMQPLQRSRAFTAFCVKGDALAAEIEKQSD